MKNANLTERKLNTMTRPFGIEYLEPMTDSDVMGAQAAPQQGGTGCVPAQTYHIKSGTVTNDLVCND